MENSSPNKSSLHPFRIQTQDTAFDLPPGQNLLDALEQTGHDVSYQCRHGYCGSCRVALLSGRVDYAEPPLAFLQKENIGRLKWASIKIVRQMALLYNRAFILNQRNSY